MRSAAGSAGGWARGGALIAAVLLGTPGAGADDRQPAPGERHYIARSRAACEGIDYTCPEGSVSFQDGAGCGCERRGERREPPR